MSWKIRARLAAIPLIRFAHTTMFPTGQAAHPFGQSAVRVNKPPPSAVSRLKSSDPISPARLPCAAASSDQTQHPLRTIYTSIVSAMVAGRFSGSIAPNSGTYSASRNVRRAISVSKAMTPNRTAAFNDTSQFLIQFSLLDYMEASSAERISHASSLGLRWKEFSDGEQQANGRNRRKSAVENTDLRSFRWREQ